MSCPFEVQQAFVLSSFVTFLTGLAILYIGRLVKITFKKCHCFKGVIRSDKLLLKISKFHGAFRKSIDLLLSAQTFVGRVLMVLVFALSIGSLVIYFINSAHPGSCAGKEDMTLPVDLAFNAFLAFYFGLRFAGADDKIKFWLEVNSVVDIFTIPPTFVSYYLNINWLGLRFLRALRLLELPQILQYLRAIKTSRVVKLCQLLSMIMSTWFTAAGFLHLVENSGDPWLKGRNSQRMSYFDAIYLVTATTSTVGFGDVVAKTTLGRIFIIFFILTSLMIFANYAPELLETLATNRKYSHSYEVVRGRKFIVVCGNITVDSVNAFLRNFLNNKAREMNFETIFLGETLPSLELETIFKVNLACTSFFLGSALKREDLKRVADYLPRIPSWDWASGDNVICFAELKLGFIAQGCLVPGLATFLTSLFVKPVQKVVPKQPWQKYFLDSLNNQIFTHILSNDFEGMTFPEVSRNIMLNPPALIKVNRNTTGFFIAKSVKEVRRAHFYCFNCHSDVNSPELIGRCDCITKKGQHTKAGESARKLENFPRKSFKGMKRMYPTKKLTNKSTAMSDFIIRDLHTLESDMENDLFDYNGMYHWCKSVPLENVILKHIEHDMTKFRNHIVVCVFGNSQSPLVGLRNFVMPLRTSNYTFKELKDIVFVGSLDYLQKEWRFLRNFPKLYILPGSALFLGDLIAANIRECSMCAILAQPTQLSSNEVMVDAESILATLNIHSLPVSSNLSEESGSQHNSHCTSFCEKCRRIPIITELKNSSNIHFIEPLSGIYPGFPGKSLPLSTSFSTGSVFSDRCLDSLLATAFYNYRVLEFLQMIVTGGVSHEIEPCVEKENVAAHDSSFSLLFGRGRCKLALLSLSTTMLRDLPARDTFGEIFCGSLDNFGILCLGLYRLIDDEPQNPLQKRFVITRPDNDFELHPTDLMFCAIPFNIAHYNESTLLSESTSDFKSNLSKMSEYDATGRKGGEKEEEGEREGGRTTKKISLLRRRDSEDEEVQAQAAASYNRRSIDTISKFCKLLFLAIETEEKPGK